MLVHDRGEERRCSTSSSPRRASAGPSAAPSWCRSRSTSTETPQVFNIGAASCGVPGVPAGLDAGGSSASARCRWPSWSAPAVAAGARGRRGRTRSRRYLFEILGADPDPRRRGGRDLRARGPAPGARATRSASRSWPTRSSGSAPRAPSRSTAATIAAAVARLGASSAAARSGAEDLAAYEPIAREPVRARVSRPRGRSPTRRRPRAGS